MSGDSASGGIERLSPDTLCKVPSAVGRPTYDREAQRTGIVHFGIGAFHRAHQAAYTDEAMAAGDRDWSITGVSLRSAIVRDQLEPQRGLYSILERSACESSVRVAGAIRNVLVAPESHCAVIDAVASSSTKILSFTVTEKGYYRALDGSLDLSDPLIADDLRANTAPATIYGLVHRGLARRHKARLPGLTLISCDNLANNGLMLAECMRMFLDACDRPLARWFETECACPSTMVDRIVPAATLDELALLAKRLGVRDEAAVATEPFRQWVIEDQFVGTRPRWDIGGAAFVADVHGYEIAKLRLLNGAHSALAYLGLLAGHVFVHEAISDPAIRKLVDQLMRNEALPTLPYMRGFDPDAYVDRLIARFENPSLQHRLSQIAMDGSQKIPPRWLAVLTANAAAGRESPAIFSALAAWISFIRADRFRNEDPMAVTLQSLWASHGEQEIVGALFGSGGVFRAYWIASETAQRQIYYKLMDFI